MTYTLLHPEDVCPCRDRMVVTLRHNGLARYTLNGIPTGRFHFGHEVCGACNCFRRARAQQKEIRERAAAAEEKQRRQYRKDRKRLWGDRDESTTLS